jgi:hypothetical protein
MRENQEKATLVGFMLLGVVVGVLAYAFSVVTEEKKAAPAPPAPPPPPPPPPPPADPPAA